MKVAVLGPSLAALQITKKLHELGASVRLFWGPGEVTAELEQLRTANVVNFHPWARVTKRFLLPGQIPSEKTRFADLFRVSYQVDPNPIIEKSKSEQPEIYEKMTEDFLSSLTGQLEMFEDVDVIIDASPALPLMTMGPGGMAVGESKLRAGTHFVMHEGAPVQEWLGDSREIALIGAGRLGQAALLSLASWLEQPGHRVFVITTESLPFQKVNPEMQNLLQREAQVHQQELQEYAKKDAEWLGLDDFIQAKKPRPEIPIPRMVVFSAHAVTAADQLVDKTRTFLTCETLPWEQGQMHPENNGLELKTIGVDKVIVATGTRRRWENFQGLDLIPSSDGKDARSPDGTHPEVGFYTLGDREPSSARQLEIINSLQKLFSRVGA